MKSIQRALCRHPLFLGIYCTRGLSTQSSSPAELCALLLACKWWIPPRKPRLPLSPSTAEKMLPMG